MINRNKLKAGILNPSVTNTWAAFSAKAILNISLLGLASRYFEANQFNYWLLLNVFIGLQGIGDLGLSQVYTRAMSQAYSGADEIKIIDKSFQGEKKGVINEGLLSSLIGTYVRTVKWASIIYGLLLTIVGYFTLSDAVSGQGSMLYAVLSFLITILTIIVATRGNIYSIGLESIGRLYYSKKIDTIVNIFAIITNIILLIITKSILTLCVVNLLVIMIIIYNKRKALLESELGTAFSNKKYDNKIFSFLLPISLKSWLGSLFSYGLIQFTGLYLGGKLIPSKSSSFLLTIKVLDILKNLANAPFYSRIPFLNKIFINDERSVLIDFAEIRMRESIVVYFLGAGFLFLFGNDILALIGSSAALVSTKTLVYLISAFLLERVGALHIQLYSLSNHIVWHIANGITAILYLVFVGGLDYLNIDLITAVSSSFLFANGLFYMPYALKKSVTYYNIDLLSHFRNVLIIPFVFILSLIYFIIYA